MTDGSKKHALLLVHRIPYPPDKGDKIRSWRLFRFLAERFRLSAGFFIDDPADFQHVQFLSEYCDDVKPVSLNPLKARIRSGTGLLTGKPLTFPYYYSRDLQNWVRQKRRSGVDLEVAFSSSMAPYLADATAPTIVDLVDADSAKWRQYASQHSFPMSWVYAREAGKLAAAEAGITQQASASFLITEQEAALVKAHPAADPVKVDWYQNGVDTEYFSPEHEFKATMDARYIVFTGAMDYWANVDAVTSFAHRVWPQVLVQHPDLHFAIVGAKPAPEVRSLSGSRNIIVTDRVPDVRPWLDGASLSVAPLRVARGVQNKVLEAMAMAKPVVASPEAAEGLSVEDGVDIRMAGSSDQMITDIANLLANEQQSLNMGAQARARVCQDYSWEQQFQRLEQKLRHLELL